MEPTPEFAHLQQSFDHELREAVTLSRGWLQAALRNWRTLGEDEREQMITAALFGTNRVAFLLDILSGEPEEQVTPAAERMADDLLGITRAVLEDPEL